MYVYNIRISKFLKKVFSICTALFNLRQTSPPRKYRGGGEILLYSSTLALGVDGWPTPRPGRFIPGKEQGCPSYRRLGGPQSPMGMMDMEKRKSLVHDRPACSDSLYGLGRSANSNVY